MALTCRTLIGVALPALLVCPMMPSQAVAQEVEIATAVSALEGPTVDRDGNVYFSEMVSQRIMKLSKEGVLSTYREHSNASNGLLIDPEGRLVACEGAESRRTGVISVRVTGRISAAARSRSWPRGIRVSHWSAPTTSPSTARGGSTSPTGRVSPFTASMRPER